MNSVIFDNEHFRSLAEDALDAFWQAVVHRYPEVTSGDLSPMTSIHLQLAAEGAIREWVSNNVPSFKAE